MNQATRVIQKFGSVDRLAKALSQVDCPKDLSTIHRWRYADGLIPSFCLPYVVQAARLEGILLTSEDLDPRPNLKES